MASEKYKQWSVVAASTTAFTVCFMVWMMFAVIGIPIKQSLGLNETEFGILVAMPVLTGSLIRLPLGMWTDRFGGRLVFFVLMLSTVIPIWMISWATEFWQFLVTGLFVGITGGSFTVGIAYCARWFPKNRQGFAMGIFGAGNTGAAITKLVAPTIVVAYGWERVPQIYAILMLVTTLLFWMFTFTDHEHTAGSSKVTIKEQLEALKDPAVWRYSQYYSIVFGGFVALSLWMTKYYISEYGFDIQLAALLAAGFSVPGGLLRAVGGWFSDKYGAHSVTWWVLWVALVCLFFLSYPQSDFTIHTVSGPKTFPCRAQSDRVHDPHVYHGHLLRHRQGVGVQVHLGRLSAQHRRGFRRRRPCWRYGRLHPADPFRGAGGPDRSAFVGVHAAVRDRLGVADVDVLRRSAADERDAEQQASATRAGGDPQLSPGIRQPAIPPRSAPRYGPRLRRTRVAPGGHPTQDHCTQEPR